MRACVGGHRELALKLYNRDHTVIKKTNAKGETCLDLAKASGHHDIVTVIDCLESARLLESKNASFLTITPSKGHLDKPEFARPFDIISWYDTLLLDRKLPKGQFNFCSCKKSRTKSLDEHRQSSPSLSSQSRCRMKLRSSSPFYSSSPASSPLQPLTISIDNSQRSAASASFLMTRKQLFKRASFDLSLSKNKDFKSARYGLLQSSGGTFSGTTHATFNLFQNEGKAA